ncbi:hypothetical protein QNA23_10775 [Rhodococcus erythropolis]|uniref:hypothetical protein n=1 Tax=Rhodococcus erythropolis TaxID=1833 RepID=UPI0024B9631D|nr:hypothetical protein [Rhodococcus erythropolis]MDJ0403966.1 hypothetical protein [Rhodococcus erythropolis]
MPNLALLIDTLNYLHEHPELHDETHWHNGETGSLAGWVCVRAGAAINGVARKQWATYQEKDRGIIDLAIELLALERADADAILFNITNREATTAARAFILEQETKPHE